MDLRCIWMIMPSGKPYDDVRWWFSTISWQEITPQVTHGQWRVKEEIIPKLLRSQKKYINMFWSPLYHVDMKSYKSALSTCCTKLPVVVRGHGLEGHEVQIGCFWKTSKCWTKHETHVMFYFDYQHFILEETHDASLFALEHAHSKKLAKRPTQTWGEHCHEVVKSL